MSVLRVFGRGLAAKAGVLFLLAGCASTAQYNQVSYDNAVSIKAETLSLIDKSSGRFAANRAAAETLATKYDAAYDIASRDKTDANVAQAWDSIRGPRSGSAGEYLLTWKQRGTIRPKTRTEKRAQIARHFDYVICLEQAKRSGATCVNPFTAPAASPAPAATPAADPVEPVEMESADPGEPPSN